MKKIIWKYPLAPEFIVGKHTDAKVDLPAGARIVHVELLEDTRVVLWVEFTVGDDWDGLTPPTVANYMRRVGTGCIVPERYQHFHTFITEGSFVWHLYRFEDHG